MRVTSKMFSIVTLQKTDLGLIPTWTVHVFFCVEFYFIQQSRQRHVIRLTEDE